MVKTFSEHPTAEPAALGEAPTPAESDSIEVNVDEGDDAEMQLAPAAQPALGDAEPFRERSASSPSAAEILERAAVLGPVRMTWESYTSPTDLILDEKRQPHVAERRARLTRVVKVALGGCLGLCVLALGASALSADSSAPSRASLSIGKTVASIGFVPVETLDGSRHAKAARRVSPTVTTATIARPKHR